MNVSALEEYGLRCAVSLASLKPEETLSAPEIAEREGLSVEYVSKFMLYLKKAELVKTVRGVNGGFALAKPASEISLKEVFEALGGKNRGVSDEEFCNGFVGKSDNCVHQSDCSIRPFWKILSNFIGAFTSKMTLQDMLSTETETLSKMKNIQGSNWHE